MVCCVQRVAGRQVLRGVQLGHGNPDWGGCVGGANARSRAALRMTLTRTTTCLVVAVWGAQSLSAQGPLRKFEAADLNRIERFDEVVFSPDGERIAIVKLRARQTGGFFGRSELQGYDRADVWIRDRNPRRPRTSPRGSETEAVSGGRRGRRTASNSRCSRRAAGESGCGSGTASDFAALELERPPALCGRA